MTTPWNAQFVRHPEMPSVKPMKDNAEDLRRGELLAATERTRQPAQDPGDDAEERAREYPFSRHGLALLLEII